MCQDFTALVETFTPSCYTRSLPWGNIARWVATRRSYQHFILGHTFQWRTPSYLSTNLQTCLTVRRCVRQICNLHSHGMQQPCRTEHTLVACSNPAEQSTLCVLDDCCPTVFWQKIDARCCGRRSWISSLSAAAGIYLLPENSVMLFSVPVWAIKPKCFMLEHCIQCAFRSTEGRYDLPD